MLMITPKTGRPQRAASPGTPLPVVFMDVSAVLCRHERSTPIRIAPVSIP
ncbi:MAG: hypothetical protein LBG44_05885 [Gemmatimonadota bacterium]|nr:hypothetical protein [Gemmatimonadota bacterium]